MQGTVAVFLHFSMKFEKVSLIIEIKKIAKLSRIETDCVNNNQEGGFK